MSDPKRHPLPAISRPAFDDRTETDSPGAGARLPSITKPTFDDKTQRDSPTELATLPGDKPSPAAPPAPPVGGAAAPTTKLPPTSLDPAAYAGRMDDLEPVSGVMPKAEMALDANGRLVVPGRGPMTTPANGLPAADLLSVGVDAWPSAPDPATKPHPAASPLVRPPERREPPRPRRDDPGLPPSRRDVGGGGLPPIRRELPPALAPLVAPPVVKPARSSLPELELEPATMMIPPRTFKDAGDLGEEEAEEELPPRPARSRGAWLALKVALALIVIGGAGLYLAVGKRVPLSSMLEVGPKPTLEIRSRPNGATVKINGEVVGTTPLVKENLYPTDQDTEVQVSYRGYKTWTWKFRGGKSFSLEVELRR